MKIRLPFKMECLILLMSISALCAIRVPSTWEENMYFNRYYKEMRPMRYDQHHQRQFSLPFNRKTSQHYARPQTSTASYFSAPNTRSNWVPAVSQEHKMSTKKKQVLPKSTSNKKLHHPYKKKNTYEKPFKPSLSGLTLYSVPLKNTGHDIFFKPEQIQQNFFNIPQSLDNVDSLGVSQPRNLEKPTTFKYLPSFTTTIPYSEKAEQFHEFGSLPKNQPKISENHPFLNNFPSSTTILPYSKQFSETPGNHKQENDQKYIQVDHLPTFTTTAPIVSNYHQNFNIPTLLKSMGSIKNQKFGDQHFNKPSMYESTGSLRNHKLDHQNFSKPSSGHKPVFSIQNHQPENHLYKNYRDDRTHEPENNPVYDQINLPEFQRDESEKSLTSSHEYPAEIPTRPIYPGKGQWAKPGIKHRPFISKQTYDDLEENEGEPDGYDTFLEGEKLFNEQNKHFGKSLHRFPERHELGNFLENASNTNTNSSSNVEEESKIDDDEEVEDEEEEFVPTKLYAQVRRSEDVEHLPAGEGEEERLREAIKESKIQTVYTEEGYEDSAYDHAGHEKEAENDEGFEDLDRGKETKNEEKVPAAKYNLHLLPRYESTKYGDEDELPTDEEIEEYKREQLGLEDSDPEGSQYGISPNLTEDIHEERTRAYSRPEKRKVRNNNHFMSTKETKTMTTKENNDGDTETEISSRVRVIMQPNSTKPHKFVKSYPKIYRSTNRKNMKNELKNDEAIVARVEEIYPEPNRNSMNSNGIYIEEIITTTTEIPFTTISPEEFTETFTEEIPITTLATTAIPNMKKTSYKNEVPNVLESIEKAFWGFRTNRRRKRFANDFPKIQVNNDFISKISHDLGSPEKDSAKIKYPYYEQYEKDGIHENSPLRYSEDLGNIPVKEENKMSFYEQAESRNECPEIESTVNPIPERIRQAEKKGQASETESEENEEEEAEGNEANERDKSVKLPDQPNTPRLSGLGDKIDCLKAKYFGKNPLDSPFFAEQTVGSVKPIFKELRLKRAHTENGDNNDDKAITNDVTKENEVYKGYAKETGQYAMKIMNENHTDNSERSKNNRKIQSTQATDSPMNIENLDRNVFNDITNNMNRVTRNEQEVTEATPTVQTMPTVSLLTTPQYTIDLKPKHIYDQIQLLNHLAGEENSSSNDTAPNGIQLVPNIEIDKDTSSMRQSKMYEKEEEDNLTYDSTADSPSLPDAEALRRRRKYRIRRKRPSYFNMKIVSSTTPHPIFTNHITASTVLPKYKVISEVFYKDDIKPNEQLHVFTDILNNIRDSTRETSEDDSQDSLDSITEASISSKNRIDLLKHAKKYGEDSYLKAYGSQELDDNYYSPTVTSTTTTTVKPKVYRGSISYSAQPIRNKLKTTTPVNNELQANDKYKLYNALWNAKRNLLFETTTTSADDVETVHSPDYNGDDSQDPTTKVMGLMPPGSHRYKTIYHPKRDNKHHFTNPGYVEKKIMNNFFVMGMKPPPRQRVFSYSDFMNSNHIRNRRGPLRRGKRSTNRSSYAQLSRHRDQQEESVEEPVMNEDNDDDDYVPHRPKNFYYDEKTGKIVYTNDKKSDEEDEEDIEYVEIVEEPPKTNSKPKQNPIFATAIPPPEGQSYIDFVKKLKSAPDYKLIPDPTTTERGPELSTEKVIYTTDKPEATPPPEYLNILKKLKESSEYKLIEDKKEGETKSTTTQATVEMVEENDDEEEDELPQTNVRNSPGGIQYEKPQGFQIFDISDYIPKLKNYLPRTSIDTSKYKTIERPTSAPISKTESIADEDTSKPNNAPGNQGIENLTDTVEEGTVTDGKEERIPSTTTASITTTTAKEQVTMSSTIQTRRRRPTTLRSVRTTKRFTPNTSPLPETQIEHHPKPRRNYRRRPTRIRVTTEKNSEEDVDDTTRVLRRRSNLREPNLNQRLIVSTEASTTAKSLSNRRKLGPEKYAEILKRYHMNKRLEDNSKRAGTATRLKHSSIEPVSEAARKSKDVEIIGEYDKTKRHGGNYRRENEDDIGEDSEEVDFDSDLTDNLQEVPKEKSLIINLLPKYSEEEQETITENPSVRSSAPERSTPELTTTSKQPKRINRRPRKKYHEKNKPVQRLTDVVTKPDTYYTDPMLPRSINMLVAVDTATNEELENITEEDVINEDISSVEIINSSSSSTSTKKPRYIEDPSKRLYYYAPL